MPVVLVVAALVGVSATVTIAASLPDRAEPPAAVGPDRSASATTTTTGPERSPYAAGAVDHDALLSASDATPSATPVGLAVGRLGILATVAPVGLDPAGGVAVPSGSRTAGWYRFGAAPGAAGSTVVVGHVNLDGRQGVFARLTDARPGDAIVVTMSDGSNRSYVVAERQQYVKQEAPLDELFRTDGPSRLVLITCGGELDRARHSYEDNVVVTAVPSP